LFQGKVGKKTRYKCLHCSKILMGCQLLGKHLRLNAKREISCEGVCPDGVSLPDAQLNFIFKQPHICSVCAREFAKMKEVTYHEFAIHGIRPKNLIECEECGYATVFATVMRQHQKVCHTHTEKKEMCEMCGKAFRFHYEVKTHIRDVHTKKLRIFKCSYCPQTFIRSFRKKAHEKLHLGVKEFPCRFCGKLFAVQYNMKIHERIHTGDKPHQCQVCGAAFAQQNSLDVHMAKHGLAKEGKGVKQKRERLEQVPAAGY
jgi:KRAB domain-containing zinc finger protein